ncbi:MAG TPA: hypothetical protein VGD29_02010 [Actinoplanes sp.]|jgi:hypothetical protein
MIIGGDATESIAAGIAAWAGSEAMTALLAEFGFGPLPGGSPGDRLAALSSISDRWDYRKGAERSHAVGEEFSPGTAARIEAAAAGLGLAGQQTPAYEAYDHVLVLGGGVLTMRARAEFAAEVMRRGLSAATIAGIGSLRPLENPECPTEGDAVDAGLRQALGLGEPTGFRAGVSDLGQPWWIRTWDDAAGTGISLAGTQVHVLAAPSTRPGMRANTGDGYLGWAELVQPHPVGARLLLVTSDIFVPFQHCDAVRLLGLRYGCRIDTIGFSTAANPWVKTPRTFEILQEVRSAIFSMLALYNALP